MISKPPIVFLPVLLAYCSTFFGAGLAEGTEPKLLSGEDVFDLAYAKAPVISPDGNWIIYQRIEADESSDKFASTFLIHNLASGTTRELTDRKGYQGTPAWSPDSQTFCVAFTRDDQTGIAVIYASGKRVKQTIETVALPQHLSWNSNGTMLAYSAFVKIPQRRLVPLREEAESGKWAPSVIEIHRPIYRRDGQGYLKHGHTQLFCYDLEIGKARQLTETSYHHTGPFVWQDDHTILFTGTLIPDWEYSPRRSQLHSLDVNAEKPTVNQLTEFSGPLSSPVISPNRDYVALIGYRDNGSSYQQSDIYLYHLDTMALSCLTKEFDRSVNSLKWRIQNQLHFQYDDHGVGHIASIQPDDQQINTICSDFGGISIGRPYQGGTFSVSNRGAIAYPESSLSRPPEVAIMNKGERTVISTCTTSFLESHRVGEVKRFNYKSSFDGKQIDGWVVFPPDYDAATPGKKFPLILEIHGGPFANYGSRFAMEPQLYAAKGYIVIYTNPRGSTSYGEEFAQLINKDYPQQGDFEDLMSAIDHSIEHFSADEDRLYVTGGSGGGILTAWLVVKTDRFKAAVSQKPVINWETLAYTSDGYIYFTKYWFDGPPTKAPEEYRRRSPLSYVDKVTTPTMLMTGEEDWRTPITEAEQFYQALQLHQVDTMLVRVPKSSHSIAARPSRIWMKLDYITNWFDRYQ